MKVTVAHEIKECNECPHANNSTREHNCAFTSAP